jgi:type II secretory pathway pseudopilin PulG
MSIAKLKEQGDTIVEVLIATTIIGAILAGAYVVASKNIVTERQAQERSIALQLLQNQYETMQSGDVTGLPVLPSASPPANFCIVGTSVVPTSPAPNCSFNSDGSVNTTGTEPDYHISISVVNSNQTNSSNFFEGYYSATINWDELGGVAGQQETASLVFRV